MSKNAEGVSAQTLTGLRAPATDEEIDWKIQSCGMRDGQIWALVVPYLSNRAVQDRLDDVCGPENWQNRFEPGPSGGVLCGIGIKVATPSGPEWVWKFDGAENTDIEKVKGGLSNSMKRAIVQWGGGRDLYRLPKVKFATIVQGRGPGIQRGRLKKEDGGKVFYWKPPTLAELGGGATDDDAPQEATPSPGSAQPDGQPMTDQQKRRFQAFLKSEFLLEKTKDGIRRFLGNPHTAAEAREWITRIQEEIAKRGAGPEGNEPPEPSQAPATSHSPLSRPHEGPPL